MRIDWPLQVIGWALALTMGVQLIASQSTGLMPKFRAIDPVTIENDRTGDASGFKPIELSESFDLIENQFGSPGDRTPMRALNVNTIDEVPDSSWFTNRIGIRSMSLEELVRGANKFDPRDAEQWDTWVIVSGKGPGGFQPGFRAERPGDPGQVYQLEVDPKGHPRLATGAEFIGNLVYHAIGYNVEDFYVLKIDPRNLTISEKATIKDASGERRFTTHDLNNVLRVAAKDDRGLVYFSAARYDGEDVGHFQYHGLRRDDPNDLYPHEHRRELRANRVFSAWLAHDDSRSLNTRNVRRRSESGTYIQHYMHDFGAIMGSSTRFPEPPLSNHEYYVEKKEGLRQLLTLGLLRQKGLRRVTRPDDAPPSVGVFESKSFDPMHWKANYPNPAFSNMQPDDAFWGARLVSRFSDEVLRAMAGHAGYDDPRAVEYLVNTLAARRDIIERVWLNGVNPIVDVSLSRDGALTFANAAVAAGAASHGVYTIAWASFDNRSGTAGERVAVESHASPQGTAPPALRSRAQYIEATIWSQHPEQPGWSQPVRVYFRKDGGSWKTVGLLRDVRPEAKQRTH